MKVNTPDGTLTIDDDRFTYKPVDDGPELTASLSPMPDFRYERGVYGTGSLVIGDHVIPLDNEHASSVIEELQRPRNTSKARKPEHRAEHRSDSDTATAK